MSTLLKNNWLVITAIALFAVALFGLKASAQPSSVTFETTAVATTTRMFIGNGTATTTFQVDSNLSSSGKVPNVQTIDAASLYLQVEASTTATTYSITPQFSNNNIDWYGVASSSTNGANAFTASPTSYTWTPGTVATSTLVLLLPAIPAAHERVVLSAAGGAGAIYLEVDLKKNPQTP